MNTSTKSKVWLFALCALALAGCGSSEEPAAASKSERAHAEHDDHEVAGGDGHVQLTDAQLTSSGIVLQQAGPASIRETLPVYGVIAPNAERVRDVGARFPGLIQTVTKKIGDDVRQGDALASVESNESLQTYSIVAPLGGTVIARNANPGEQTGDKVLFTIADLSTVWVELSLFPKDVAKVKVGQQVSVRSGDNGLNGAGKIVYVAPFGTSANQTLTARVLLANEQRRWAPGLYVNAEITLAESEVPVAVRSEALQTWEGATVVFVRSEEGFAPQPVQTGRADSQWTEMITGVAPGATYAATNSFILKAELGKGAAEHEH
jgi:cobalt-zinc-cadmium efflux system membrane fusion protein